jgi:hypothetical protein
MNEIQLLRAQLAAERRHVLAMASSCAGAHRCASTSPETPALAALAQASTRYLALVVGWFEARDAHLTALGTHLPPGEALGREALCAANPRVKDWRVFARIDADSIHEERALYGRVRTALPAGLALE